MDVDVLAASPDDAIEKALRDPQRPRAKLSAFIGVETDGAEELLYPTERFLQEFRAKLGPIPKPPPDAPSELLLEWGLRKTGMTESQLTREFMSRLIDQGKNPFASLPDHALEEAR